MSARRVFFLTAARSEYDLMAPIMSAAREDARLWTGVVVAGAHLSPFHGMGIETIRRDGFPIVAELETLLAAESWSARSLSFAQLVEGLTRALSANRPDILFVAGDREEALAGALVGNFLRIHVAHSHGGDRAIAAEIDEVLRPAISKLSHFHFAATEGHRQRLIQMGEADERVFNVGAAGLDRLRTEPDATRDEILAALDVDVDLPYFLVIQHPTTTMSPENSGREMRELLTGVLDLGHPVLCSYPNFDPGNMAIRSVIDELKAANPLLRVHHNFDRRTFVTLYRHATAVVGNSSSIILEAGFLHVPGVLVGPRQDLRERGPHVLRVEPTFAEVRAACQRALDDTAFLDEVKRAPSLYGDGHSAARIVQKLAELPLDPEVLLKVMPY